MDIPRGLGEVVRASRTTSNLFDKLGAELVAQRIDATRQLRALCS
jgi:hypothetical protein